MKILIVHDGKNGNIAELWTPELSRLGTITEAVGSAQALLTLHAEPAFNFLIISVSLGDTKGADLIREIRADARTEHLACALVGALTQVTDTVPLKAAWISSTYPIERLSELIGRLAKT